MWFGWWPRIPESDVKGADCWNLGNGWYNAPFSMGRKFFKNCWNSRSSQIDTSYRGFKACWVHLWAYFWTKSTTLLTFRPDMVKTRPEVDVYQCKTTRFSVFLNKTRQWDFRVYPPLTRSQPLSTNLHSWPVYQSFILLPFSSLWDFIIEEWRLES